MIITATIPAPDLAAAIFKIVANAGMLTAAGAGVALFFAAGGRRATTLSSGAAIFASRRRRLSSAALAGRASDPLGATRRLLFGSAAHA